MSVEALKTECAGNWKTVGLGRVWRQRGPPSSELNDAPGTEADLRQQKQASSAEASCTSSDSPPQARSLPPPRTLGLRLRSAMPLGNFRTAFRRELADDPDHFYPLRTDAVDTTPSRFRLKPGKTLSPRYWRLAFNGEGQLDMRKVLKRVQRGGVHPDIRGEVWEFLLGCFSPTSTGEERAILRLSRRAQYAKLKAECQVLDSAVGSGVVVTSPRTEGGVDLSAPPSEEESLGSPFNDVDLSEKVIQWKTLLHQIGLDVVRTDRMLEFYEDLKNQAKLSDILAVYAWLDPEIGYCQGMSDFCSPLAMLFANEADAFWCFERLMRRVRDNFKATSTSVGVQKQLAKLGAIIGLTDPKLHGHLDAIGGGDYLFALRMVMVLFRRELSFADTIYLWEMIWAMEYNSELMALYGEESFAENVGLESFGSRRHSRSAVVAGKFEKQVAKYAPKLEGDMPLAIFCAAAIFETKRRQLKETEGIDGVLKLLNDVTGHVDAKATCKKGLKLHKQYLAKAKKVATD